MTSAGIISMRGHVKSQAPIWSVYLQKACGPVKQQQASLDVCRDKSAWVMVHNQRLGRSLMLPPSWSEVLTT